ncbi:MAG: saccharopine dehydrogenase family protein, partial [Gammaproteobacteria bacterium]
QVPGFPADALPILDADGHDPASLARLAARTRVLVSTVGPYALHGTELLRACAEAGTDYCDLTGEVQWLHRVIADFDPVARASGARLVHCCGFDSVPFDMGVWYLQREALARQGRAYAEVHGVVRRIRGSFSGGTYASMLNLVEEASREPALRRVLTDANALLPAGHARGRGRTRNGVAEEPALGVWTAPFVMAAVNTKIVRRSNALLGSPWGEDFRYEESMATGTGTSGRLRALGMAAGLGGFMASAAIGPGRALLRRVLPAPGEGPDRAAREAGSYRIDFVGVAPQEAPRLVASVSASRDPGYGSTARMLAECALCLAQDGVSSDGGSWTHAACMAEPLLERLRGRAGLDFTLREQAPA